jgi:hypothetical protein
VPLHPIDSEYHVWPGGSHQPEVCWILNKNETLGLKFDVLDNNKETLVVKEAVKRIEEEVTKFTF